MMIAKNIFEISSPAAEIQYFEFLATKWNFRGEHKHFFISHSQFLAITLYLERFLQWKTTILPFFDPRNSFL